MVRGGHVQPIMVGCLCAGPLRPLRPAGTWMGVAPVADTPVGKLHDTYGIASSIQRKQPGGASSRLLSTIASDRYSGIWHSPTCLFVRESVCSVPAPHSLHTSR